MSVAGPLYAAAVLQKEFVTMAADDSDDSDPFKGRAYGDYVFLTIPDRNFYIGRLSPSQREKWRQDHPERWKTRKDALRDLPARAGIEVEPTKASSLTSANQARTSDESSDHLRALSEDKRLSEKPVSNPTSPTIANAEVTASVEDEIVVDGRRFVSERRVAKMLGLSQRQLQRWRKEGKGPPSTKIGRRVFYELDELQKWIDRKKGQ
jgi:predicted DNA-binding transcriptional regulator AlpA